MAAVRAHACDVERRLYDDADMETLLRENRFFRENYENVFVIRKDYAAEIYGIWRALV